ncbi:MAG: DPP IV N-terminal domain-containing protein, partial [Bacteroidota bacterium]
MKRFNAFGLIFIGVFFTINIFAQKDISVEDIWQNYIFYPKSVPGFNFLNDGEHYTKLENGVVKKYNFKSGAFVEDLFTADAINNRFFNKEMDDYSFSTDEGKMLVKNGTESIYRHSNIANYYSYDRSSGKFIPLRENEKVRNATYNHNADKVAYSFENNLYIKDLESGKATQVTEDGEENSIINGTPDWVYEEEFGFDQAFEWSPDGKYIGFIRFDESEVPQFTMTKFNDDAYPEYVTWKYPKVGEKNAVVSAHVYELATGKTMKVDLGNDEHYIPRIKYTKIPCFCPFNSWDIMFVISYIY